MTLIPATYYRARAVRTVDDAGIEVWAIWGRANTDTVQVGMTFEILDGEYSGHRLPWYGYWTKNSWERTVQSLRYCGFTGNDLMDLNNQDLSNEVSVKVEHEDYDGETYARIAWVNQGHSGVRMANPMSIDELRMFSARMQSGLGGGTPQRQQSKRQQPQRQQPPSTPPHPDDLPF